MRMAADDSGQRRLIALPVEGPQQLAVLMPLIHLLTH